MSSNLFHIGPVVGVDLQTPSLEWTSTPGPGGMRGLRLSGEVSWTQAKQLRELCSNEHRRQTAGNATGVLETFYVDHDKFRAFSSWCLLEECDPATGWEEELSELVPITLTATHLGRQRRIRITRSARSKGNSFGLVAHSIVVDPFGATDFAVPPGGTKGTRAYDASHPRDLTNPSPAAGAGQLVFYDGTVTDSTDQLDVVVLPRLDGTDVGPPAWVLNRGGDARGVERREEREVYGPSHACALASDLGVTNGLVSFWVGNEGLPPFLNLQAVSTAWNEVGCLGFNTTKQLLGSHYWRVTPDETVIILVVESFGEVFVTLKRGERMLRIQSPPGLVPTWLGTPPPSRATRLINWPAKFGNGIDGGGPSTGTWSAPFPTWSGDARYSWSGGRLEPDVRLRWPALVQNEGSTVLWYRAERAAATLAEVGFLSIFDSHGAAVAQLWMDTDLRIKLKVGSHTVQSAVQTFVANDDLMIAARWGTGGITLTVRTPNGAVSHYTDAAAPVLASAPYDIAYLATFGNALGEGNLGEGNLGGDTFVPGGTIDNHMLWRRRLTDTEVATLAAAVNSLDGVSARPQGDLVWYAPFDVAPIVSLPTMSGGERVDPVTDAWGFQRVIAALDDELDECAAYLARTETLSGVTDQHRHFAAEFDQEVRAR